MLLIIAAFDLLAVLLIYLYYTTPGMDALLPLALIISVTLVEIVVIFIMLNRLRKERERSWFIVVLILHLFILLPLAAHLIVVEAGMSVRAFWLAIAIPIFLAATLMPGCISVAASVAIGLFMEFLFPTLKRIKWLGRLAGLFSVTVILYLSYFLLNYYRLDEMYFLIFLITIIVLAVISIVFLVLHRRYRMKTEFKRSRYALWVFLASVMWVGIHIINFAIFFEGI